MSRYTIVSADVHITEPPDIWENHLAKKYMEHAPKLVQDHEGGDAWQFAYGDPNPIGLTTTPGKRFEEFRWHGVKYAEVRPGCINGKARLEDMDVDGIDAEIIFPPQRTIGHWLGMPDEDVSLAGIDAYNSYAFDEFVNDPARQIPMYQIPSLGIDAALKYVAKAVEKGAKGVIISNWPSGKAELSRDDDPFWAALIEAKLALTIHISLVGRDQRVKAHTSGVQVTSGVKKGAPNANARAIGGMAGVFAAVPPIIGQMIFQGVFDRFPDLRVLLIETGVGWIPHFVEQLDDRYWRNRVWGEIDIKEPPSYYWFRNFAATFMTDFNGVAQRHAVGVENMMWSTDYPHHGADWPYSRRVIDQQFAGVPQDERAKILAGNAVQYWNLEG
ncbi:MAG TPA: amidohydrolase family protein [Actinomycetota bacterium]